MNFHDLIYILKEFIYLLCKVLSEGGKTLQEAGNQIGDYGYNPSKRWWWLGLGKAVKMERGGQVCD